MIITLNKKEIPYYLFTFVFCFADILNNGNLNLLYFYSLGMIMFILIKRKTFWRDLLVYIVPIVISQLVFLLFSKQEITWVKTIVYIIKLVLNIALLSFFKENFGKKDYSKVRTYISICFFIFLIFSILTVRMPWLWRLNDPYNNFSKTRLEFFFLEPSVLGLICGYFLVFHFYSIIEFGYTKKVIRLILLFSIILLLTFSMSAIGYTVISILCLVFLEVFRHTGRVKGRALAVCTAVILIALVVLTTSNPISSRLFAMIRGEDSSLFYRWNLSTGSFWKVLEVTKGWGLGMGNMSTPYGLKNLQNTGIMGIYANSFLYFIAENGYLGVIYIVYIFAIILFHIRKQSKNPNDPTSLKIALLVFVFLEQIVGGYFTDPLIWCVYGIICSKKVDKHMLNI